MVFKTYKGELNMKKPNRKPEVQLVGNDGNAYAIMGAVKSALQKAGADKEYIDQYLEESMEGDYDNLLVVAMKYADVY